MAQRDVDEEKDWTEAELRALVDHARRQHRQGDDQAAARTLLALAEDLGLSQAAVLRGMQELGAAPRRRLPPWALVSLGALGCAALMWGLTDRRATPHVDTRTVEASAPAPAAQAERGPAWEGEAQEVRPGVWSLALPSPAAESDLGGDGTRWAVHTPATESIRVVDLVRRRAHCSIPATGAPRFTVGREMILVVDRNTGAARTFDLDCEETSSGAVQLLGPITHLEMGADASGRALVRWADTFDPRAPARVGLLDPSTWTLREFTDDRGLPLSKQSHCPRDASHFRASANGKTYAAWCTGVAPSGVEVLRVDADAATTAFAQRTAGPLNPNADGSRIYTAIGPFGGDALPLEAFEGLPHAVYLPAATGNGFIGISDVRPRPTPRTDGVAPRVTVFDDAGQALGLRVVLDEPMGTLDQYARTNFTIDQRFAWLADQSQLATIPATNDRVMFRSARRD